MENTFILYAYCPAGVRLFGKHRISALKILTGLCQLFRHRSCCPSLREGLISPCTYGPHLMHNCSDDVISLTNVLLLCKGAHVPLDGRRPRLFGWLLLLLEPRWRAAQAVSFEGTTNAAAVTEQQWQTHRQAITASNQQLCIALYGQSRACMDGYRSIHVWAGQGGAQQI